MTTTEMQIEEMVIRTEEAVLSLNLLNRSGRTVAACESCLTGNHSNPLMTLAVASGDLKCNCACHKS